MIKEQEIWKSIPGYENYEASTLGKIRSLNYRGLGKIQELKINTTPNGYALTQLVNGLNKRKFLIHQLIAMTFLDHKPEGHKIVIDHINSDKLDNRLENIQIVTTRQNCSKEKTLKSGLPTGVTSPKRTKKFIARISINGKRQLLGSFSTPEKASQAYQKALQNLI
jgi:hypothetical protein